MTDLLNLPCLRVTGYEDRGDHYFVTAGGDLEPGACSGCGHEDYYRHGAQKQILMDTPIHGSLPMDVAKDFRDLQVALGNWNKEIFNYYENPVTTAYTESLRHRPAN
ncbi:MAG: hypothetical protein RBT16_14075 [Desulfococcus multivorans]|jgi:hypothetical protein|nr:hypothetical protein [Desulfococcus multivorans]